VPAGWARRRRLGTVVLVGLLAALVAGGSTARAAGPPQIGAVWASEVLATSARLHAEIDPDGLFTTYHFEYIPKAAYQANLAEGKEGFAGAARTPSGADAPLGSGTSAIAVSQPLSPLAPETAYSYRLVARSSAGSAASPTLGITTLGFGGGSRLLDDRGWEMVSPVDKNGGQVDPPGANAGGGVLQAAADGRWVTYGSSASFGESAPGAPTASQYISRRGAESWSTENITVPLVSGSYGDEPDGVPYQLFSGDLARGLLLNGRHCRGGGEGCAVANPPLPGTGAPAGYQNYYLRDNATGSFEALITSSEVSEFAPGPAQFELGFAGAAADLRHVVLSSCAALTPNAVEAMKGEGCDPNGPNLYEWSGAGLSSINLLPGQSQGTPGAVLAAQARAVSDDGSHIYWNSLESGNLYLRAAGQTKLVDLAVGGEGSFQTAAADGSVAFFTKAEHLFRYDAASESVADLTPAGEVQGVLGASEDGSYVYYLTAAGLFLRHGAATTEIAAAADPGNYPPTTGTARVSADGTRLAFLSAAALTGYDNTDLATGKPDAEVYLYDDAAATLACISCNPTEGRPIGPSSIPGAIPNGEGPGATDSYKPRALSADGGRLFFDSEDALVLADTNRAPDVYEWEAQGVGGCSRSGGCIGLVSSGKTTPGASFVDASDSGSDVFFLTDGSLVPSDPGSVDLYDARVGGGFPVPPTPIPCEGDACQSLPSEPVDPAVTTLITGPGNPAVHYAKARRRRSAHRHDRRRCHHHRRSCARHRPGHHRGAPR